MYISAELNKRLTKTGEPCNYLQAIEGGIDTAHSSFAHNNDLENPRLLRTLDPHPRLEVEVKDYGYTYASIRNISEETIYLRVYQFVMPFQQFRGGMLDAEGRPAKITDEWWDAHEHANGRGQADYIDRSREALGSTDHAIQAARRLLIEAMEDVQNERPPRGTDPETYARVRGADMLVPRGSDWRDASKETTKSYW